VEENKDRGKDREGLLVICAVIPSLLPGQNPPIPHSPSLHAHGRLSRHSADHTDSTWSKGLNPNGRFGARWRLVDRRIHVPMTFRITPPGENEPGDGKELRSLF